MSLKGKKECSIKSLFSKHGACGSKRTDKKDAILKAASKIFLKVGYKEANMDVIADMAGVSKQTIYAHFGSKDALFMEIMGSKCAQHQEVLSPKDIAERPVAEVLYELGYSFLDNICQGDSVALFRLMIAESVNNKKLAETFWKNGPECTLSGIAAYLKTQHDKGTIKVDNFDRAAETFIYMIKGNITMHLLLNIRKRVPFDEKDQHVKYAVKTFLDAYKA